MKSAFQYIVQLKHTEKPNYELIKLWMAFDEEDEKMVFQTKLNINNNRLANEILYDLSELRVNDRQIEERKVEERKKEEGPINKNDMDEDYNFDQDVDEQNVYQKSIEFNVSKIDNRKLIIEKKRNFILNYNHRSSLLSNGNKGSGSISESGSDGLSAGCDSKQLDLHNASLNGSVNSKKK